MREPVGAQGDAGDLSLSLSLSFVPSEQLVPALARLVSDCCEIGLRDLDLRARFHMAAHELAENITKYSTAARVSLQVELAERDGVQIMSVTTRNQSSP